MAFMDAYTGPWTSAEAAHLARRTIFGVTPPNLSAMVTAGMSASVNAIVDYSPVDQPLEDSIAALVAPEPDPANLGARVENYRIKNPWEQRDLEGWWIYRFVNSSQPFQQQFALFQHDHFATEWGKLSNTVTNAINDGNNGSPLPGATQSCTSGSMPPDAYGQRKKIVELMRNQHNLFLTQGHLAYRAMLIAITRDPAMLIYLDNRLNVKGKAQENYGREVMELFTMGPDMGNYSEADVREISKSFTGETIRTSCSLNWPYDYVYTTTSHDTTTKTIFGTSVPNGYAAETETVLDLILNRTSPVYPAYKATALYISWKFITWFVDHTIPISHDAVKELATIFYANTPAGYNYNVRETLRVLLKSQLFYDTSHRWAMYKHPVDFMVTALRNLGFQESSYTGTAYNSLRLMGMQLFDPPTVEGWHHGKPWINSSSLIARFNYADRLATASQGILLDPAIEALVGAAKPIANYDDNAGIIEYFRARLLQDYVLTPEEVAVFNQMYVTIKGSAITTSQSIFYRKVRATLHTMMTMPRYQLK